MNTTITYHSFLSRIKKILTSLFVTITIADFIILVVSFCLYVSLDNNSVLLINELKQIAFALLMTAILCISGYFFTIRANKIKNNLFELCDNVIYEKIISTLNVNKKYNSLLNDKIMNNVAIIYDFLKNKATISLFEIPLLPMLMIMIYFLSKTCFFVCLMYLILSILTIIIQNNIYSVSLATNNFSSKEKKNTKDEDCDLISYDDVIEHQYKKKKTNNDYFSIFSNIIFQKNEKYMLCYHNLKELYFAKFSEYNNVSSLMKCLLLYFCSIFLFVVNAIFFAQGEHSVGSFTVVNILIFKFLTLTKNISLTILPFLKTKNSILELIKYAKKINDTRLNDKIISAKKTSILLSNVGFTHPVINKQLLNNVNYAFKDSMIYVVTSNPINCINSDSLTEVNSVNIDILLDIISGECRPTSGCIKRYNADNEYNFMSYCPLEPVFINGASISEMVSNFSNKLDCVKIKNMLSNVNLLDDVENMQNGIDTILTDKSCYSSEFIKKLNIATALFGNSNVIVLNEPFVLLDNKTINKLLCIFEEMRKLGKIIIISCKKENIVKMIKIRTTCDIINIENIVNCDIKNNTDININTDANAQ